VNLLLSIEETASFAYCSFLMFVEENSGQLQPLTCEDLRLILTEADIINRLDVHDVTDYQILQFDMSEVSGILYLLYNSKLNPEYFRGTILIDRPIIF